MQFNICVDRQLSHSFATKFLSQLGIERNSLKPNGSIYSKLVANNMGISETGQEQNQVKYKTLYFLRVKGIDLLRGHQYLGDGPEQGHAFPSVQVFLWVLQGWFWFPRVDLASVWGGY